MRKAQIYIKRNFKHFKREKMGERGVVAELGGLSRGGGVNISLLRWPAGASSKKITVHAERRSK